MTAHSEMVLRVAQVLFEFDSPNKIWDKCHDDEKRFYWFPLAKAAIEAMKKYTPEMYEAGCRAYSEEPGEAYEAMMTAALGGEK